MKNFTRLLVYLLLSVPAVSAFAATPTLSGFAPTAAALDQTVIINGTNFTGITQVLFGGVPASSFTVISPTQISAVVAAGNTGAVSVVNADGTGTRNGFFYLTTTRVITDFGGYWSSSTSAPNPLVPDNTQNLLAFTFNGITYSTGVNDGILNTNAVTYTQGNFRALPVDAIAGTTSGGSTYLAVASRIDGSSSSGVVAGVAGYSVKSVLTDGINGLNLGTGVTNLPQSAVMTFNITHIDPARVSDNEPDIILTQIAQPVTGNDTYSFVDGAANQVGISLSQDMTLLPAFGTYSLDLFTLPSGTPYNTATASGVFASNTSREMRLVAFRLSDFGINASNVSQVRALQIVPSGNSDYAFIAYNANAISISGTLPVKLGSFKASKAGTQVKLQWIAYDQSNTDRFEIERSLNGKDFSTILSLSAKDGNGDIPYETYDVQPGAGLIYYRIKEVYRNGNVEASRIVSINIAAKQGNIMVFPNPVHGKRINLQFNNIPEGAYSIRIINTTGQALANFNVSHKGIYNTYHFTLPASVKSGTANIIVLDNNGQIKNTFPVLIQ